MPTPRHKEYTEDRGRRYSGPDIGLYGDNRCKHSLHGYMFSVNYQSLPEEHQVRLRCPTTEEPDKHHGGIDIFAFSTSSGLRLVTEATVELCFQAGKGGYVATEVCNIKALKTGLLGKQAQRKYEQWIKDGGLTQLAAHKEDIF